MMIDTVIRAERITKTFPGVLALDRVDFDLVPGEVHALVGENGAGKSTLVRILSGSYRPDSGSIFVRGQKLNIEDPRHARMLGIGSVYQELSLVPQLSVAENLFLGREVRGRMFLRNGEMQRIAAAVLGDLMCDIDPRVPVGTLNRAERQMVEIGKVLLEQLEILILDEPTASLTEKEVDNLFQILQAFKRKGVGIIYVSHRLKELDRIADRVTVLRDGEKVGTLPVAEAKESVLIKLMTGREFQEVFPAIASEPGEEVVRVKNLRTRAGLEYVSFGVRAGEVLGVGGLIGSGKSEVGRALFGLDPIVDGEVRLFGQCLQDISPQRMIEQGVMYFPADRHEEGLVLCRSVKENMTLSSLRSLERFGLLQRQTEERVARDLVQRLDIRPPDVERGARYLSGGNQQKVVLAKSLARAIRVFIFDEPTRGIDVGAKVEVYRFVERVARGGAAVILISSELPEILNLCHRVLVMYRMRLVRELAHEEASEEVLLRAYFGHSDGGSPRGG